MNDIKFLLNKYDKPTSAERYTKEYKKKLKQKQAIKNRHLFFISTILLKLQKGRINLEY